MEGLPAFNRGDNVEDYLVALSRFFENQPQLDALLRGGAMNLSTTGVANSTVASVMTANSGPTGAATAIQGWITVTVAGVTHYVPYW